MTSNAAGPLQAAGSTVVRVRPAAKQAAVLLGGAVAVAPDFTMIPLEIRSALGLL